MLPEADYGLTSQALDGDPLGPNSRYQGDEFLLVRFFKHPKINPQASARTCLRACTLAMGPDVMIQACA